MRRNTAWVLISTFALAGAGFGSWGFFWKTRSGEDGPPTKLQTPTLSSNAIPSADEVKVPRDKEFQAPASRTNLPQLTADQPDTAATLLRQLKTNYQSGTLPVRIRLQDQLSQYWEQNPPSANELLALVGDRSLPAEMRLYLARTFANRVKTRAYSAEEKETSFAELRVLVASNEEDAAFRADLATVLITMDPSDAAVLTITPLLTAADRQAVAKAVSALTKTTNPLAIEAVYQLVLNDEALLKSNPTALLAALGPLSTTDHDVTSMLNRMIEQTDDFKLYAGAIQCLIQAKSSAAVLESIVKADAARHRFPQQAEQILHLCRAAATKHAAFIEEKRASIPAGTAEALDNIMKKESGK